ncbi:MAG: hypothetical protein KAG61_09955 [Bacteriovoracaceae bacterium]|nr:hypothetical protein [Bacteriovoracaceae bacterium]
MTDKNLLTLLFTEADTYSSLESIEELLQEGMDLVHHPIQPLYLGLKSLPPEVTGMHLTQFSPEQRKVFMDIDLWQRDDLNTQDFGYWIKAYESCPDEDLRYDFIQGNEFLLWLKARVNIWTFDVEDPLYPDHDNYFLTDDSLLLVEFDDTFEFTYEVRRFIRELYSIWGVERAYAHLFKMVSGSFLVIQEEEYQAKKSLQSDFGFVDYFDALELTSAFSQKALLDSFIKKHTPTTGAIDEVAQKQNLHSNALLAYKRDMDLIFTELQKVSDEKRTRFLNFDFIRLVNATLTIDDALKSGPVAMAKVGRKARAMLLLGLEYAKSSRIDEPVEGEFSQFLFSDIYRIGTSLIQIGQRKINRALNKYQYDDSKESFLGRYWNEFLLASFDDVPKYLAKVSEKPLEINSNELCSLWENDIELLEGILPFINGFRGIFDEMKKSGNLSDDFYLNYTLADIDFESIIISNYANFVLGHFDDEDHAPRLGISISEFKTFAQSCLKDSKVIDQTSQLSKFKTRFGLDKLENLDGYLMKLLREYLEGYDYNELSDDDFAHIGGPIILTHLKH